MDIVQIGTQILGQKLGLSSDSGALTGALSSLLGGDDSGGGIDIGSLISKMQGNGNLLGMVSSFLGDGANESMGGSDIASLFGGDQVSSFASKLGISQEAASEGLSEAIPAMIDKASQGGQMLESLGGVSGALDAVKKLF